MGCSSLIVVGFFVFVVFSIVVSMANRSIQGPEAQSSAAPSPIDQAKILELAKQKFEASIADRYKELMALKNAGDARGALRVLKQFERFNRTDYENVQSLASETYKADALARLVALAPTDTAGLARIYKELSTLAPADGEYKRNAAKYSKLWKSQEEKRIAQEKREAEEKAAADAKAAQEKAATDARSKMLQSQFSGWDGSHRPLEKLIKATMNDPDSYKHVETTYNDKGNYILVQTTFRGKNAFGGVVKNWVRAKYSIDGVLIAVEAQGP